MKWQMTVCLMSLLLLLSVEAVDPLEERMKLQEVTKSRKYLMLKLLTELLESDDNLLENDFTSLSPGDGEESSVEERSVNAGIPRRRQKTPCKLFFWKTFSHC
ncbi:somatostatin-1B-like isoform X2 [Chiloscyllium plagiosum]|uniref:somatostatin-1B-like isoform X2 n=1 Tax=Chiloscyllium plagiosum TaxID=36176 RepID=UPI001CB88437|nr:somatostatin-1B-like isoform X2 [Chiloscyllium plagiosum]